MTFSMCGRKVGIYPLLLRRICLVRLLCRWGFVLPWCLLAASFPLLPITCMGWPQYLFEIPWTLKIFRPSSQICICPDSASCCKSEGYQRFPWGRPNGRLPVGFLLTCHPRRHEHSSKSDVRTSCSSAFDTWRLGSWVRMALLCSRRDLGWWRMKSSFDQPRPAWSGCNQKTSWWSLVTSVLLSNPLRC